MSEPRSRTGNEIRCPYCGDAQMDPWEMHDGPGEDYEAKCDDCGKEFRFSVVVETWFTTEPMETE